MSVTPSYLAYVVDQLACYGPVVARRMFGGVGLYHNGLFFGAVDEDAVYLRVDDESRPNYQERGMPALSPVKSRPDLVMQGYYQLPPDILDDREELVVWLRHAIAAAAAAPRKSRRSPEPGTAKRKPGRPPKEASTKTPAPRK